MKTLKQPLDSSLSQNVRTYLAHPEETLFWDIETTGLSARNSALYLVGAAAMEEGELILRQWFAEDMSEEEDVLRAFCHYAASYTQLVDYNGTSFDLPYLQARCRHYGLSCPLSPLPAIDLYKRISPYKNVLRLSNCRQKTLEEYLGLHRADPYSGGELIHVYHAYRTGRNPLLLKILLQHNAEDLTGMLHILPVLGIQAALSGHVNQAVPDVSDRATAADADTAHCPDELCLTLTLSLPLSIPLTLHREGCTFYGSGREGYLRLPVREDELKYFFPDYKNYSYLPKEDMAVHKSVAVYVDKAHRTPATPDTCYIHKAGRFLPLPPGSRWENTPVFRYAPKKEGYLLLEEAFLKDPDLLTRYAGEVLSWLGQGSKA